MSAITELADRLWGLDVAGNAGLLEACRQRLFDTLATFAAGSLTPEGQLLRSFLDNQTSPGEMALIRYLCGTIRCTEIDDIHAPSCATIGSVVVPVAAVMARQRRLPDGLVARALVAGYEAMASLGEFIDGAHRVYHGVWPTYFCAPFGAAACAALLGLNGGQAAQAMAVAASRGTGLVGRQPAERGARWFLLGCAAVDGYLAASAAAAGIEGDLDILEGAFPATLGDCNPGGLAPRPRPVIQDVDSKPYRTARQTLSVTEALLSICEANPRKIARHVEVWLPAQVLSLFDRPAPAGLRQAMGVQWQLATALLAPFALFDARHPAHPAPADDAQMAATMGRVSVAGDDGLSVLYPLHWAGRVRVTFEDGSDNEREVLDAHGSAADPLTWEELIVKHCSVMGASGGDTGWLADLERTCRAFGERPEASTMSAILATLPPGVLP
ncbi:MAG: MmgE/PrpD family protein [Chloroflexi bacterium]|nr:MmgE/PrpD family protein [Chloroflexota bacterium]